MRVTDANDDPRNPVNRYPWNRKGTKLRERMEQFLALADLLNEEGDSLPHSKATTRQHLAYLRDLLDRTPQELRSPTTTKPKEDHQ